MATDNKYDRQLRLWGARGQRALSEAHILLVNADGSGTEVANITTVSECTWSSYDV